MATDLEKQLRTMTPVTVKAEEDEWDSIAAGTVTPGAQPVDPWDELAGPATPVDTAPKEPPIADEPEPWTVANTLGSAGKSIVRGVAGMAAFVPRVAAVGHGLISQAIGTDQPGTFDAQFNQNMWDLARGIEDTAGTYFPKAIKRQPISLAEQKPGEDLGVLDRLQFDATPMQDPRFWVEGVGELLPQLLGQKMLFNAALKGFAGAAGRTAAIATARDAGLAALAAASAAGAMEGVQTADELQRKGATALEQASAGGLMAVGSTLLNGISNMSMWGKIGERMGYTEWSKLTKMLIAGLTEGATEYGEEPLESKIKREFGYQTKEEAYKQWVEGLNVIFPSFFAGAAGAAGETSTEKMAPPAAPPPLNLDEHVRDPKAKEAAEQEARVAYDQEEKKEKKRAKKKRAKQTKTTKLKSGETTITAEGVTAEEFEKATLTPAEKANLATKQKMGLTEQEALAEVISEREPMEEPLPPTDEEIDAAAVRAVQPPPPPTPPTEPPAPIQQPVAQQPVAPQPVAQIDNAPSVVPDTTVQQAPVQPAVNPVENPVENTPTPIRNTEQGLRYAVASKDQTELLSRLEEMGWAVVGIREDGGGKPGLGVVTSSSPDGYTFHFRDDGPRDMERVQRNRQPADRFAWVVVSRPSVSPTATQNQASPNRVNPESRSGIKAPEPVAPAFPAPVESRPEVRQMTAAEAAPGYVSNVELIERILRDAPAEEKRGIEYKKLFNEALKASIEIRNGAGKKAGKTPKQRFFNRVFDVFKANDREEPEEHISPIAVRNPAAPAQEGVEKKIPPPENGKIRFVHRQRNPNINEKVAVAMFVNADKASSIKGYGENLFYTDISPDEEGVVDLNSLSARKDLARRLVERAESGNSSIELDQYLERVSRGGYNAEEIISDEADIKNIVDHAGIFDSDIQDEIYWAYGGEKGIFLTRDGAVIYPGHFDNVHPADENEYGELISPIAVRNPQRPVDVEESQRAYNEVALKNLDKAGVIRAYKSRNDMPSDVRRQFETKDMYAFYSDGEIHIDLSRTPAGTVPLAVTHETIHLGIRQWLMNQKKDAVAWWDNIVKTMPAAKLLDAGERRFQDEGGYDPTNPLHRRAAADEVIAETAGAILRGDPTTQQKSLWQKIVQKLRDLYRRFIGDLELTDFEITRIAQDGLLAAEQLDAKFGEAMRPEGERFSDISPMMARKGSPNRVNPEGGPARDVPRGGVMGANFDVASDIQEERNRFAVEYADKLVADLGKSRQTVANLKAKLAKTNNPLVRDDIEAEIRTIEKGAKALAEKAEPLTWEQTAAWANKMAKKVGVGNPKALERLATALASKFEFNKIGALVTALADYATADVVAKRKAMDAIKTDPNAKKEDILRAELEARLAMDNAVALFGHDFASARAFGRGNNYRKALRTLDNNNKSLTPEAQGRVMRELLKQGYGYDEAFDMLSAIDPTNKEAVAKLLQTATKAPDFSDYVYEYFINSWMSAPLTQVKNIMNNSLNLAERLLLDAATEKIDLIRGGTKVAAGEAKFARAAAFASMGFALRQAGRLFWDESYQLPTEYGPAFGQDYQPAMPGRIGWLERIPGRFAKAADAFFKIVAFTCSSNKYAFRRAAEKLGKGATNAELAAEATRILNDEFDPSDADYQQALNETNKVTMTQVNRKTHPVLSQLMRIREAPGGRWLFPFMRIVMGSLDLAIEHTGIKVVTDALKGNRIDTEEALKGILGIGMMSYMASLALAGGASGGGPDDWKERKYLEQMAGWQPYSVKKDGEWVPFMALEPYAMLLGMGADLGEIKRDNTLDTQEKVAKVFKKIGDNFLSRSYMANVKNVVEAFYGKNPSYFSNFATAAVPYSNLFAHLAAATDPYRRKAEGFAEKVKAKLPGWSKTLSPELDPFGKPVRRPGADLGVLDYLTSPFKGTKVTEDPVNKAFLKYGIKPVGASDFIRGYELKGQELEDFKAEVGNKVYKAGEMWLTKGLKPEIAIERYRRAVSRMLRPIRKRWLRKLVAEGKISRAAARKASAVEREETYGQRLFVDEEE